VPSVNSSGDNFWGAASVRRAIEIDGLARALDIGDASVVSLVGGGGKTTALFALGRQLSGTRVLTTTTKMGADRAEGFDPLLDPSDDVLVSQLGRDGVALVWAGIDDHRALGVGSATCDRWSNFVDHVVIEADGSRRRPFKAPAAHEPVVPASTSLLVGCVGAAAFDGVIADVCHRPEEVAAVANCAVGDRLTAARLAAVLGSPNGTQKGRPVGAQFVVLLNQVEPHHDEFVAALDADLGGDVALIEVATFRPVDR